MKFETDQEPASIKTLDSLRGIFCISVLINHFNILPILTQDSFDDPTISRFFNNLAQSSVDGFICMSGFILSFCYKKKIETAFEAGFFNFLRAFLKYWANRIARIYPLVFFATTLNLIIQNSFFPGDSEMIVCQYFLIWIWKKECPTIPIVHDNYPIWSLCVEMTLYIFFPFFILIFYKCRKFLNLYILLGLLTLHPLFHNSLRLFIDYKTSSFEIFGFPALFRGIEAFLIGMIFFEIYRLKHRDSFYYDIVGFVCMFSYILISWLCEVIHVYLILLFISIACSLKSITLFKWILEIGPLVKMGAISYTVYLIHFPLLKIIMFMGEKYNYNIHEDYFRNFIIQVGYSSFVILFCLAVNSYYEIPAKNLFRNIWEKVDKSLFQDRQVQDKEVIQKELEKMKIQLI